MRRNLGRVLTAGAALATVLTLITPAGAADPPDTVKLDAERTVPADVRILAASREGVLFTVAHPAIGNSIPADDPSGRAQTTWLKPSDPVRPAVQVDVDYRALSGEYVFAASGSEVRFRRIASGETRSCPTASIPEAFIPTGWVDVGSAGEYTLTTIGPTGCTTQPLATHPSTRLKAADDRGFVVQDDTTANRQLKYATYADPTNLRTIAMGDQHGLVADMVRLAGDAVAWNIRNQSSNGQPPNPLGWVYRGSTTGAAPTEAVVNREVSSLAITPTHTGWASVREEWPGYPGGLFGTIPVGGTSSAERHSTKTVASSGTTFVVDTRGGVSGIARFAYVDAIGWVIWDVPNLPPVASAVAIGAGRVSYSDARSDRQHHRLIRGYQAGRPPVLGPEVWWTGSYSTGRLSQDGRRTAFTTSQGLFVQIEGQAARQLWYSEPNRFVGTLTVSGTRVLWVIMKTDPNCDPPNCPPPQPEWVSLYDARTNQTTALPGQPNSAYGLWGNYFVASKADGTILRRDLSSTLVQTVKGPGQRLADLDAHGGYVAWASCETENCDGSGTRIGYRNMATGAVPVELPTSNTRHIRLAGGYLAYATGSTSHQTLAVQGLGATAPAAIGPLSGDLLAAREPFDIHDETVAWVGQDVTARIAPLSAYVDRPRYLGNAINPPSFYPDTGGRWMPEFPVSKSLSACGIAISRGTTAVRAIDCATTTGSALGSWDGRDSAGRPVPKGQYTWTLHGRDADGWLLWWNGSGSPITGTVTVN